MNKFLTQPRWTVSYQGEVDYVVGHPSTNGHPTVRIRHTLWHSLLDSLNDPDQFWRSDIASIGVVLWKYCPWHHDYCRKFPEAEVGAMFPGYPLGRSTPDWSIEVLGDFPVLVATQHELQPLHEFETAQPVQSDRILWQGIAPEMTKALWFEVIFPELYPSIRSKIAQFLVKKGVEIPSHPPIPNTPYLYQVSLGHRWQIRLSRTYESTQFWHKSKGWIDNEHQATIYYSEAEAQKAVDASMCSR